MTEIDQTSLHAIIREPGRSLGVARATLFGFNIEWITDTPTAISSERLANPTFLGPANAQSGLPAPWQKVMQFQGGLKFQLEEGQNLAGGAALRMHVYDFAATGGGAGLVQPQCWVRAGETLRVVLWARCQGEPVELTLGFRYRGLVGPVYGAATVKIAASHFTRYQVDIPITGGDERCRFFCFATGNGIVYFDRISARPIDQPTHRADTLAAMSELAPADIRWPGGCVASNYHWWRGVGAEERRHDDKDATFFWDLCYSWGTDDYLDLCRRLGARPHITINIGTGTVREAGEWAAYCADWYRRQGVEPPEMVWQIGNEHGGAHEIGHMTGPMYAEVLREYVPAIRANYPRPLIASVCLGGSTWMDDIFAAGAADYVDLFCTHFYACRVDQQPAREGLAFIGDAVDFARNLDDMAAAIAAHGACIPLGVTEWGAFRGETHNDAKFYEPHTPLTTLFVSAMLNEFCRRAERVVLANNYSLINTMPAIVARGARVERTAVHDIFRFWRPLFPAEILAIEQDGPTFAIPHSTTDPAPWDMRDADAHASTLPLLDVLAGRGEMGEWLLLTNRHPEIAMTVELPARYRGATADFLLPTANGDGFRRPPTSAPVTGPLVLPPCAHCRLVHT